LIAKMTEKIYKTTQGTAFTRLETVSMNLWPRIDWESLWR
jgi:hypothetical protein